MEEAPGPAAPGHGMARSRFGAPASRVLGTENLGLLEAFQSLSQRDSPPAYQDNEARFMVEQTRFLAHLLQVLEVLAGVVPLIMFGAFLLNGPFNLIQLELSRMGVLLWDASLSALFFLQHSVMARKWFRDSISNVIPPHYYPTAFVIISGIVLSAVVIFWRPSGALLYRLDDLPRSLFRALFFVALAVIVWSRCTLRSAGPVIAIPLEDPLAGKSLSPAELVARGPYSVVRHPLYSSLIALIWLCPDLTLDRLLFNILWTVWIYVGATLEEKDLVEDFGDVYRQYQRRAPMLVPLGKAFGHRYSPGA